MFRTVEKLLPELKDHFNRGLDHLKNELIKIRTGKASINMLDGILVEYYGSMMPINQVANMGLADSKTLTIQPWEKKMLGTIEQAIFAANIGFTPQNDGEFIRITLPPLTEERRRELVKQAKHLGEDTKVGLRNERHKALDFLKKEVKDGYPEDAAKRMENKVQDMVNEYGDKINEMVKNKENDIMTI